MNGRFRVRMTAAYPGWVLSQDGRIQGPSGKWLKPFPKRHGYLFVTMYKGGGSWEHIPVHTAICTAFHGPRKNGLQVRHLNGVNTDNRAENLAWGTGSENQADRVLHGTDHRGSKHYATRLRNQDVIQIRDLRAYGFTRVDIGAWYGITPSAVGKIASRVNWGWLA